MSQCFFHLRPYAKTLLSGLFSYINLVIIEVTLAYNGFARVAFFRLHPLWRRLFLVFVISVWIFGLSRLVRVNIFFDAGAVYVCLVSAHTGCFMRLCLRALHIISR